MWSETNYSRLHTKRLQSTLKFHVLIDGSVKVVYKMFPQLTCMSAGSISASPETSTCKMRQFSVKEKDLKVWISFTNEKIIKGFRVRQEMVLSLTVSI